MTSNEIRSQFLNFFASKEHAIVPGAPVVIKNDPTLLFTNAGMNQFKDFFLGNKVAPFKRAADTQKCLRVSGKHNDLEEVGVDTYHHTLFEMLGNWSFGDYFKKEAIAWSWELLTEVYKLDKDRLYVTIFEGDASENLPKDEEAYNEWKKWIAEDRILLGNKKDNFWEMGDTGPCGPCTEIHFDSRPDEERQKIDGKTLVNNDDPLVIEIWNNVFMQFNRLKDKSLEPLPAMHVDTGMGFERLVRVIQGKTSNYDTDVFTGTIAEIAKITGNVYNFSDTKQDIAFRVLADHIRAICFTIADGQLPSNTGAGYVIRRILRRAVRYYYTYLNYNATLLHQLVAGLATQFEFVFPELKQQESFVAKVVKEEEESFLRTLEKGLKKIDDIIATSKSANQTEINGKLAFELFDTYGFPIDLTRLIASEQGLSIDEAGFDSELAQQKARSRAATAIDTDDWIVLKNNDEITFVGYHDFHVPTVVTKYRKVKAKGKEQYQIVLETTPFYAESGGQVGDIGTLTFSNSNEVVNVVDTKKENNLIIHLVNELPAELDGEVIAAIDFTTRIKTSLNHTATHLMQSALKQVLGAHVNQKGSLNNSEILRFDFSHFSKLTDEEIRAVELIVNEKIRENIPVVIKEMAKEDAIAAGATALFGEKYGDTVRVVTIDPNFSVELCGGTHIGYTGMIGLFTITSEGAVAAGVRRIEALTGAEAINFVANKVSQFKLVTELLKTKDPLKSVEKLLADKIALEKKIEQLENKQLAVVAKELAANVESVNNIQFIGADVEVSSQDGLRKLCSDLKALLANNFMVILTANISDKAAVAVSISDDIATSKDLDAGKMIKQTISPLIKGGGGGQKTLATAGGQLVEALPEVIKAVKGLL